jgi:hypothetical protein
MIATNSQPEAEGDTEHIGARPSAVARLVCVRPILDPRNNIARPDLVDAALAGLVAAARYVVPAAMICVVPRTAMRSAGNAGAVAVSELIFGEGFDLFEQVGGWAFGRSGHDRYTGWVLAESLAPVAGSTPIQSITASIAPVFSAPDIKSAVLAELPLGARIGGAPGERFFAVSDGGYIHNRHLDPLPPTPLAVARRFTGAPYLWGGRTPFGVDCSGLVQAALGACGIAAPRDSDQQRDALGQAITMAERAAGDLVFFPGHVGILSGRDTLVHANAHWMATVEEPLANVIDRLAAAGVAEPVSGLRRL